MDNLIDEHFKLKCWFDKEYPPLEQKYRRLNTLYNAGIITTEEGRIAYSELIALYNKAEQVRSRINEIEAIINVKN